MANPPSILDLTLTVNIHFIDRPGRRQTDFVMVQTPPELWDIIPKKARFLDLDYNDMAHYQKDFSLSFKKRTYTFTFYRMVKVERRSS
jgi:hypothetical protein